MRRVISILLACGFTLAACGGGGEAQNTIITQDADTGDLGNSGSDTSSDTPFDASGPCGTVTYQGECHGSSVTWCEDDELHSVDCNEIYASGSATCEWFSDDFGYWCGLSDGDLCIDLETNEPLLCAGAEGVACTYAGHDGFSAECTHTGLPACDGDQSLEAYCDAGFLVTGCLVNQPRAWDCASFGATCEGTRCADVGEGGRCVPGVLDCELGLDCAGVSGGVGTCSAGCGDVSELGECDGSLIEYCDDGLPRLLDCNEILTVGEATCDWSGDEHGADCVYLEGEPCINEYGEGYLCVGSGETACFDRVDGGEFGSACINAGFPACDPDTFEGPHCQGDYLILACWIRQVYGYDCAFGGATCGDGVCVDAPLGADCVDGYIECASGLSCEGGLLGVGTCMEAVACGDVTATGHCSGTTRVWCEEGGLRSVDCAEYYPVTGTCDERPAWGGATCAVVEDDTCSEDDYGFLCAGEGAACIVSDNYWGCQIDGFPACDEDTFTQTCHGNVLLEQCLADQPFGWDCDFFGATCEGTMCVDAVAGRWCFPGFSECGSGLRCEGATDVEFGICVDA